MYTYSALMKNSHTKVIRVPNGLFFAAVYSQRLVSLFGCFPDLRENGIEKARTLTFHSAYFHELCHL